MDTSKLGQGTLIAGVSGAALFVVMFLSWYGVDLAGGLGEIAGVDTSVSANAWESFSFTDLVLLVAVIAGVGGAAMTAMGANIDLPFPVSTATAAAGGAATLFVLFRLLNPPADGLDREIGIFLGLIASAGVAYGGYMQMQEEGVSPAE